MEHNGHLYVLQGSIGELASDGDIITTDADFTVEPHWDEALGVTDSRARDRAVAALRPPEWEVRGFGEAAKGNSIWFLAVDGPVDENMGRLEQLLELASDELASRKIRPGGVLPLITMPVIGVRGGGHAGRRGDVVLRQLRLCTEFVQKHAVDLAIVTPSRSTYSALQHQRRSLETPIDEHVQALAHTAASGGLALFLGAGASLPSGLPSWSTLLEKLLERAADAPGGALLAPDEIDSIERLDSLDRAQLLQQVLGDGLAAAVVAEIKPKGKKFRPALAHVLLAGLGCREAVTTNYDSLYEQAVEATASTSEKEQKSGQKLTVMLPRELPSPDQRWLLKMHGSIDQPESIVLTRSQFSSFDSDSAPSGAILQSLMLTKHLLVVGTSMTDPNVLRLIDRVQRYRTRFGATTEGQPLGTILDVSGIPARRRLHEGTFRWIGFDGGSDTARARRMEIWLDQLAMYATEDLSWLLDPTFSGLHAQPELQTVSDTLRQVAIILGREGLPPSWQQVRDRLTGWGA